MNEDARTHGAPANDAPVSGVPADGGPVSGVPADGGPVSGVPVSGVPADGGLSYDGRVFRSVAAESAETAAGDGSSPVGHYHQDGAVVWAEFSGGQVVRGSLAGRCAPDGVLHLAYCQLLSSGDTVAGCCTSHPTVLPDGRVRLREHWQRFSPEPAAGVSVIEEVPEVSP